MHAFVQLQEKFKAYDYRPVIKIMSAEILITCML
jgi:hypothetical protein